MISKRSYFHCLTANRKPLTKFRTVLAGLGAVALLQIAALIWLLIASHSKPPPPAHQIDRFWPAASQQNPHPNPPDQNLNLSRNDLFQPATPLPTKAVAQKSIKKVRDKLKLAAILTLNNKLIAYVQVEGLGLQRCEEGTEVRNLFIVKRILAESVVIDIMGHSVSLYM